MLTLYHGDTSVCSQKVRLVLTEKEIDWEGSFIEGCPGNEMGVPIPIDEAESHIFGFALPNDWSARDIQRWESRPLGPLLGKSFNSTLAPWVVTLEAMAPYRGPLNRPKGESPDYLPYLASSADQESGGLDIDLDVFISTAAMRDNETDPHQLNVSSCLDLHWTAAQLITYVSSNGAKVGPGEILGTGTVSGPKQEEAGCIIELSWSGNSRWNCRAANPGRSLRLAMR